MIVTARVVHAADAVEINTYEQLREIDSDSSQLQTDAIQVICEALGAQQNEVTNITVLKKGMTNRSFLFSCKDKKYIMRIPGEGTDQLINRRQEAAVYQTIAGRRICDEIAYINPENGYKITEYLEGARVCDAENEEDLQKCMKKLREFHGQKLRVDHSFDLFGQMESYESLWEGTPSAYKDYETVKRDVETKEEYIEQLIKIIEEKCKKIKLIRMESEESKIHKNNTFYVDKTKGEIECYPIERKLLYAIWKISKKDTIIEDKYYLENIVLSDLLNAGNNIQKVEPIRDFNHGQH